MKSHREIMDLWPSAAELARDLKTSGDNVRQWRRRNRIPSWFFDPIVRAARERGLEGVTAEVLAVASIRPGDEAA